MSRCPLFGEVNFMPAFVFPFVRLFDSGGQLDGVYAFEVIISVLYNCGQRWFEVLIESVIHLVYLVYAMTLFLRCLIVYSYFLIHQ